MAAVAFGHVKKWPVTQLECLSLLTGIREYHVYLAAAPFVVYTDHVSLKFLQSLKLSAHNRLARWALALQPYNFTVEHVPGKRLTAADGLSRRPYDEPDNLEEDEELQDDSFIVQMDPGVFDSVTDNALKVKQEERQWHVLALSVEEDEEDHQSVTDSQTSSEHDRMCQRLHQQPLICGLHRSEIYKSCNMSRKSCSLF